MSKQPKTGLLWGNRYGIAPDVSADYGQVVAVNAAIKTICLTGRYRELAAAMADSKVIAGDLLEEMGIDRNLITSMVVYPEPIEFCEGQRARWVVRGQSGSGIVLAITSRTVTVRDDSGKVSRHNSREFILIA